MVSTKREREDIGSASVYLPEERQHFPCHQHPKNWQSLPSKPPYGPFERPPRQRAWYVRAVERCRRAAHVLEVTEEKFTWFCPRKPTAVEKRERSPDPFACACWTT
jgi:hypothetical protein